MKSKQPKLEKKVVIEEKTPKTMTLLIIFTLSQLVISMILCFYFGINNDKSGLFTSLIFLFYSICVVFTFNELDEAGYIKNKEVTTIKYYIDGKEVKLK